MRNDFETVMKTSSLHFLCWLKESLRQASKKELVHFFEREQTSPKVTEAKERALCGGGKKSFPSRRPAGGTTHSASLCIVLSPQPCYGRRIFSFTPHVAFTSLQPTIANSNIFYYHTNHLGSTAYVTDNSATITQGFLYAPFGEITTEYAPLWQNGTLPKYAFNAKELDEETGMYYYEARYYKPPVFTSRDPMFEKKPWLSPYHYCSNNPVGRVDPSGMMDGDYFDWNGNYLGWDGNDDDMVHFVSDSKSIENIKNKENNDGFTPTNDVSIDVSVSRSFILEGPIDVYNRTENNGNTKEEATFFPLEGGEPIRRTGKSIFSITWDEEPTVSVPNVPLDKTVHSHLSYTRKNLEYGIQKQWCALTPSDNPSGPADVNIKANLNVIVGINRKDLST